MGGIGREEVRTEREGEGEGEGEGGKAGMEVGTRWREEGGREAGMALQEGEGV
jgi:hypothetical protein